MGIVSRNQLKGWFVTLAKPLAAQFADWIDSFRHKTEKITAGDLDQDLLDKVNSFPPSETIALILSELQSKATIVQFQALQAQVTQLSVKVHPVVIQLTEPGSYTIPQGRILTKVWAIPDGSGTFLGIGNSVGVNDLVEAEEIAENSFGLYSLDIPSMIEKIVHFNNISASITIKLFII